jgi:hypothetical protein
MIDSPERSDLSTLKPDRTLSGLSFSGFPSFRLTFATRAVNWPSARGFIPATTDIATVVSALYPSFPAPLSDKIEQR